MYIPSSSDLSEDKRFNNGDLYLHLYHKKNVKVTTCRIFLAHVNVQCSTSPQGVVYPIPSMDVLKRSCMMLNSARPENRQDIVIKRISCVVSYCCVDVFLLVKTSKVSNPSSVSLPRLSQTHIQPTWGRQDPLSWSEAEPCINSMHAFQWFQSVSQSMST